MDQLIASELRGRLIRYSEEGERQAFEAMDPIVSLENTYKRGLGRMRALTDPAFMATRAAAEVDFRRKRPAPALTTFNDAEPRAADPARKLYAPYALLEGGTGIGTTPVAGGSQLFLWARTLVRGAQERGQAVRPAPAGVRRQPPVGRPHRPVRRKPVYPELEQIRMEWWLSKTREWLTVDQPVCAPLLGKESPEQLSARVVSGTKLADPAVRRALWEGGLAAIEASDDPMIQYLLSIQEPTRAIRTEWEEKVQAPTDRASEAPRRPALPDLRRRRLSGRHRHPAPDLRQDRGFGRARPALRRPFTTFSRPVGPGDRRRAVRRRPQAAGRAKDRIDGSTPCWT
jgi:hypothetical protein